MTGSTSLLKRLLVALLALLLPLQLIGGIIIYLNNRTLRESVFDSASADVRFLMTTLETRLINIRDQLMLMVNERDKSIRTFYVAHARYDPSEYYTRVRELINSLSVLRYNNSLLSDMELFYPTADVRISATWGLRPLAQEDMARLTAAYQTQNPTLIAVDGEYFVGQIYPITAYQQGRAPQIVLQGTLSQAALSTMLTSSGYADCPVALIGAHTGCLAINASPEAFNAWSDGASTVTLDGRLYHVFIAASDTLDCTIVKYLPDDEVFGRSQLFTRLMIFYILLSLPALLLYALILRRTVKKPVDVLLGAFHRARGGDLSQPIENEPSASEFTRLIEGFNDMQHRLHHSIETLYRQEVYTKQIELKQLQSQINPHFLYNTFFMLKHLIKDEAHESAEMLAEYLGEYFHYITRSAHLDVPLLDEYRHATNYLRIQHMRFGHRLTLDIMPMPEAAHACVVPKLILQPLFENALTHAVDKERRASRISLAFALVQGDCIVRVEDDGDTLSDEALTRLSTLLGSEEPLQETTGLINIHRRLRLRYDAPYGLALSRSDLGGLRVDMRLPITRKEDQHAALPDTDR